MTRNDHALRVGLTAVICSLIFRLCSMSLPQQLLARLLQPNTAAFLIYLETGRHVRFSPSSQENSPDFMESSPVMAPNTPLPAFSNSSDIEVKNFSSKHPDLEALLAKPLSWQLRTDEPTVLILHTHATESYQPSGDGYKQLAPWRTLDEEYNMLSVGSRVAQRLEAGGIHVLQDRTLHDYPSYNDSYIHARSSLSDYMAQYPSLRMVLDLHRDATDSSRSQLRTVAQVDGSPSAQLMVIVATNHPDYETNLSLGVKLHLQLEQQAPGITRPLQLSAQRFNQDLCSGALLVEVGAAGNSHTEALRAVDQLADAILALADGTQ